jgi:RNA-directed DNA polymerase
MHTERQQHGSDQLDLFAGQEDAMSHGATGEGGTRAGVTEVPDVCAAEEQGRALTEDLMEVVAQMDTLRSAMEHVCRNKGSAGVDGMTVDALRDWFTAHGAELGQRLRAGTYRPQPVRGVQIPKPDGGMRQLGIPTVVDRVVQEAIRHVLVPLIDPTFSASSFGFRPGRSAHDALRQAQRYIREEWREVVVDIDLEKFFDRVNHDMLMARMARRITDKPLLRLIRRFVEAGIMTDGVCMPRREGTPQGGPLSPLLANVLLDDLDKELERRGHRFCRYADDCNIYVRSTAAGERVMASVTAFIEKKLKLRINREKSAVAPVGTRTFLGYRLLSNGRMTVAPKSRKRLKDRVRAITRRNRGTSTQRIITELNALIRGWVAYFRLADCKTFLEQTDKWIRHKLRCYRLKQLKRRGTIVAYLAARGVPSRMARQTASSGKGWWRLSNSPAVKWAMSKARLAAAGLESLLDRYLMFKRNETAGCDIACPVV